MTRPRLLWLGVEPTPYLLALQDLARAELPLEVEAAFERKDSSQAWRLPGVDALVLDTLLARVRVVARVLGEHYVAVLIEGWGSRFIAAAGVAALAARVSLVVSGDTWRESQGGALRTVRRWLRRLLLRQAKATLPGGSRQREFFIAEGASPDRMIVRQMTVDIGEFGRRAEELAAGQTEIRRSLGLPPEGFVVVTVARLVPEKGIDLLLRAVREVPRVHLLVVGDGPERPVLEALAAGLGVTGRVVWAGRMSYADVVKAYVAADLSVLPSRFEPWGLVVNEALVCGLPAVVSSAVGCADDLIAGTGAGIVVPAGDVTALARAMAEFAGDTQGRQRAAARARAVIADWTLAAEIAAIRRAIEVALAT